MNTCIIYHNDPDGITSAWVVWKECSEDSTDFVPLQHSDDLDLLHYLKDFDRCYILDFSFPEDVLINAHNMLPHGLVVIDHHKTSEHLKPLPFVIYDNAQAACRITWNYFHAHDLPPVILDYIEDRDIWANKLPNTKEINAAIQSYNLTLVEWDKLMNNPIANLINEGKGIRRYQHRCIESHKKRAVIKSFAGYEVPVVACTETTLISDLVGELSKGYPFAVGTFEIDGKRVYNLRSRGDFDVSVLCKSFGGGGHKNAAGFTVPS